MPNTPYDMTNKECEEHLKGGGSFVAAGGSLRVLWFEEAERYVLVNDTGNGGEYVNARFSQLQDIMDQLAGGLAAWEFSEAPVE